MDDSRVRGSGQHLVRYVAPQSATTAHAQIAYQSSSRFECTCDACEPLNAYSLESERCCSHGRSNRTSDCVAESFNKTFEYKLQPHLDCVYSVYTGGIFFV